MSTELALGVIAAVWVAIGCTLALVMGRRGHDAFSWFAVGTILGPIAIALAVDARRRRGEGQQSRVLRRTVAGPGQIDVIVGADGSPESSAAAKGIVDLLGSRLRRLTLVSVIPYDAPPETLRLATTALEHEAATLGDGRVGVEFAFGDPAATLRELASDRGYALLAIGTKGRGRTKALLGSVASHLATGSAVPVVMFSGSAAPRSRPGARRAGVSP